MLSDIVNMTPYPEGPRNEVGFTAEFVRDHLISKDIDPFRAEDFICGYRDTREWLKDFVIDDPYGYNNSEFILRFSEELMTWEHIKEKHVRNSNVEMLVPLGKSHVCTCGKRYTAHCPNDVTAHCNTWCHIKALIRPGDVEKFKPIYDTLMCNTPAGQKRRQKLRNVNDTMTKCMEAHAKWVSAPDMVPLMAEVHERVKAVSKCVTAIEQLHLDSSNIMRNYMIIAKYESDLFRKLREDRDNARYALAGFRTLKLKSDSARGSN